MKVYLVWNEARTEGFFTTDKQLAYEARKGADHNCYYPDGTHSPLAVAFSDINGESDCVIEELEAPRYEEPSAHDWSVTQTS